MIDVRKGGEKEEETGTQDKGRSRVLPRLEYSATGLGVPERPLSLRCSLLQLADAVAPKRCREEATADIFGKHLRTAASTDSGRRSLLDPFGVAITPSYDPSLSAAVAVLTNGSTN